MVLGEGKEVNNAKNTFFCPWIAKRTEDKGDLNHVYNKQVLRVGSRISEIASWVKALAARLNLRSILKPHNHGRSCLCPK